MGGLAYDITAAESPLLPLLRGAVTLQCLQPALRLHASCLGCSCTRAPYLRGQLDGARKVGHRLLRAALRQVHVAHVGVGAGAVGLRLEDYLEEALRLLPALLRGCLHACDMTALS